MKIAEACAASGSANAFGAIEAEAAKNARIHIARKT